MANQEIELRWIFTVIRRWWWLIIGIAIIAASAAYGVTRYMPPVYSASATLLVTPAKNSTATQYNDLLASERLALTYSQMLNDRPVLTFVIKKLGLTQTPEKLAENIKAEPVRDTQLIRLTVTDSDPKQAALIANTVAEAFKAQVETLSAERYAGTIKSAQDRVSDYETQIADNQAQIDALRNQKIAKDILLTNKKASLESLQSDYRSLQNSYQDVQVNIAGATGKVYVVEPIQVQKSTLISTYLASSVISAGQVQQIGGDSQTSDRSALIYGQLLIKTPLLEKIIRDLDLAESPDQLAMKIKIELVPGTQLIRLTVNDPDGSKAMIIGQSLVDAFTTQIKDLLAEPYSDRLVSIEKQIGDITGLINRTQAEIGTLTSDIAKLDADLDLLDSNLIEIRTDYRAAQRNYEQVRITAAESSDTVVITEPAQPPKKPSQSRFIYIGLAGLVGFALGAGLAFLLGFIDDRIRTDLDIQASFEIPTLGTIGNFNKKDGELVMGSQPTSTLAEDFRVLGTHIRILCEQQNIHTLLITSPTPSEGKSVITSNLAVTLAKIGLRVVAIDADLRLPRLHQIFGLLQEEGLSTLISKRCVNGSLQTTTVDKLKVITSGCVPSDPTELLNSPYLVKLINELKQTNDLVLFDCPPVLVAADAAILASKVDGVVMVLRAGISENQTVKKSVGALKQVKANLLGVVLNAVPNRREGYYGYYDRGKAYHQN